MHDAHAAAAPAPIDADARRHAVDFPGSVLLQAPAGSGKTTLLVDRYLRLLSSVDAPERILALTFTRRAAQEMRERVMQALAQPASAASAAARRRMQELGLDLARHPSRLRIETIDAFNAWLAGQLPITAGAGARLNLTDDAGPLYQEAARRALARDTVDPFGQAVERVLELDDQRWASLVKLISDMLPSRDRWLGLLVGDLQVTRALDDGQLAAVRRQLDEDLELLVSRVLRAAGETLGAERLQSLSGLLQAAALRLDAAQSPMTAWLADATPLRAQADDLLRWRAAAATLLTKDGAFRRKLTKIEGFPQKCADKAPMTELIAELERTPGAERVLNEIRALPTPRYDDAQWSRVREVAQVMVLAALELEQVFRERGMADFTAVSMAALRALGEDGAPTDLALRLDYRLQHILVDEFQDTSGAQLELVKRLTAGWQHDDGRSIFCVGDPMQSIYGFRQAEVRAFLELAEEGIGGVRFAVERLRSNFRSAKPLVEWINHCFARILPRVDDRSRGAIAFRPSDAALRPRAAVDAADIGVRLRGFAGRREEANAIAASIADQSARHPDWRIAVLVRARSHARDIAAGLRARQVRFRAVDIEPLRDRPVVRDLIMLLCALLHPGDRRAWLALLRSPWVGLTLADLLHLARAAAVIWDALVDAAVLAGLSADGRARCARLRGILDTAFQRRGSATLTRWLEQTWLALGGPATCAGVDDLEHVAAVFARVRTLEQQALPDAAELAQSFDDLYAEHRAPAAVEIMTIHKSKGLEFDLVIVPALDRHIPGNRDQLLLSHEFARAGRAGLIMAARPGIGGDTDLLFEFLRHQTRDASGLEAQRLLYVACTRAKWQLQLTAAIGTVPQPEDAAARVAWSPRAGSLLAVLWPVCADEFTVPPAGDAVPSSDAMPASDAVPCSDAMPASDTLPADGVGAAGLRGGPLRRVPAAWSPPHEYVGAGAAAATAGVAREGLPVFDWAGETARRVGSLVHAELQVMDLQQTSEAGIRARADHYRRWLALHGVPAERLPDAAARVLAALLAVHGDARGRWILHSGYRDDLREHALTGLWQGSIVRVVFDRSFIDERGVRWVIDYKTSQHSGGDLQGFLDSEVERYRPQLQRYAHFARRLGPEPVRVGLYFPLMRTWREWEP